MDTKIFFLWYWCIRLWVLLSKFIPLQWLMKFCSEEKALRSPVRWPILFRTFLCLGPGHWHVCFVDICFPLSSEEGFRAFSGSYTAYKHEYAALEDECELSKVPWFTKSDCLNFPPQQVLTKEITEMGFYGYHFFKASFIHIIPLLSEVWQFLTSNSLQASWNWEVHKVAIVTEWTKTSFIGLYKPELISCRQ